MPQQNQLAPTNQTDNSHTPEPLPSTPSRALMDQLVSGALGPLSHLRDSIDLTLDQVSDWITQPRNRHQIANLVTLLDAQTQLIICQHRLIAVSRLAEVATSSISPETVRRACSDLLRIRLIDPYREDRRPEKMPPPPVYSEEEILATLERLGAEPPELPSEIPQEVDYIEPMQDKTSTFARANYTPSNSSVRASPPLADENLQPETDQEPVPKSSFPKGKFRVKLDRRK